MRIGYFTASKFSTTVLTLVLSSTNAHSLETLPTLRQSLETISDRYREAKFIRFSARVPVYDRMPLYSYQLRAELTASSHDDVAGDFYFLDSRFYAFRLTHGENSTPFLLTHWMRGSMPEISGPVISDSVPSTNEFLHRRTLHTLACVWGFFNNSPIGTQGGVPTDIETDLLPALNGSPSVEKELVALPPSSLLNRTVTTLVLRSSRTTAEEKPYDLLFLTFFDFEKSEYLGFSVLDVRRPKGSAPVSREEVLKLNVASLWSPEPSVQLATPLRNSESQWSIMRLFLIPSTEFPESVDRSAFTAF